MLTILADTYNKISSVIQSAAFARTSATTFIQRPARVFQVCGRNLCPDMIELRVSKKPNCRAWRNFRHYVILTGFYPSRFFAFQGYERGAERKYGYVQRKYSY